MPADDDPAEGECAHGHQAAEPGDAAALPGSGHVGAAEDGVAHDPRDGAVCDGARIVVGACGGGDPIDRPTHDQTPFTPPRTFPI